MSAVYRKYVYVVAKMPVCNPIPGNTALKLIPDISLGALAKKQRSIVFTAFFLSFLAEQLFV